MKLYVDAKCACLFLGDNNFRLYIFKKYLVLVSSHEFHELEPVIPLCIVMFYVPA